MMIRTFAAHVLALASLACTSMSTAAQAPRFEIVVPASAHARAITGRLVLLLARNAQPEPRLILSPQGPAILGADLEQLDAGQIAVIDSTATAYPAPLSALPPGDYWAQAVINVYDRVQRADGHTLWLPMNDGTIEFFTNAAGNIYSEPVLVRITNGDTIRIVADRVIPAAPGPADTEWVKHVRIQSEKLTRFWGRPIYIHATVLLPHGYAANPQTRYPTVFAFGHSVPFSFNPDSTRFRSTGQINPVTGLDTGYDFYKEWISDDFPRVIAVTFQQSTPYFPDSYSVNSASNGPYGDAMVEEVIPFLERGFRMIGKPYARIVEGASTNGWQSLALQPGLLRRRVDSATGSDRFHALPAHGHLRRRERVHDAARRPHGRKAVPANRRGTARVDDATAQHVRGCAGFTRPIRLPARSMGSGVRAPRR
jgi:hypothetical protein